MMPGLVGLAVLDCAAAGIPIVTTAYPYHSPEIDDAVVLVLQDASLRMRLSEAGKAVARRYTLDRMVDCFCEGVSQALTN